MRYQNRKNSEMRVLEFQPHVNRYAEGSVLVKYGETHVLCTATLDSTLPKWLQGSQQGWVTAEYAMLPRSTQVRIQREKSLTGGRSSEISRLVGRSLRAAVDLKKLGERQIIVDCDVLSADGGTRTAAISGGFVALAFCLKKILDLQLIKELPLTHYIGAVSVGLRGGEVLVDLDYSEDSQIDTDMNIVMNHHAEFIEIQGTAEKRPFLRSQMNEMLEGAEKGCHEIFKKQSDLIGSFFPLGVIKE